jgi:hypothetical protein
MFIKDSTEAVKNKLTILLTIDLFGSNIKKSYLVDFLIKNGIIEFFTIEQMILDMIDTSLIVQKDGILSLTEAGIISLNFFSEKLPIDFQNTIVDLARFDMISQMRKFDIVMSEPYIKVIEYSTGNLIAKFEYEKEKFKNAKEIEMYFKEFIEKIM